MIACGAFAKGFAKAPLPDRLPSRMPFGERDTVQRTNSVTDHIKSEAAQAEIAAIQTGFEAGGYVANFHIATAVYLARALDKPILVEGPPGVGKTELAKATAAHLGRELIRLQCYEGLDEAKALYEWKYGKQLLYTQVLKDKLADLMVGTDGISDAMDRLHEFDDTFFSPEFLEPRPLLKALQVPDGGVLLVDEIDKSDQEFEAFLLEILSDFQVTVPEIGTVKADVKPVVFLTSNNTREVGDALKRRCLHLYISFPDQALEMKIIDKRVPGVPESLLKQLVAFVQELRTKTIKKLPAVSETIDWARALMLLHTDELDEALVRNTLNLLLKFEDDIESVDTEISGMLRRAKDAI